MRLRERKVLRLSFKSASDFLQGLVTADLRNLQNGQFCFSALLTSNGRFVCDFFLHRINESEFLIDIHEGFAAEFTKKIKHYDLLSEVKLEETDLTVSATGEFLPSFKDGIFLGRSIGGGGSAAEYEGYHLTRIKLGIPDGFYDLEVERSVILEYGYEQLGAVSFKKGCYVGQELITRTKMLGTLRKKIFTLAGKEGLQKGEKLTQNNKEIGILLSGTSGFYLALLRFEELNGTEFDNKLKICFT